MVLPNIPELKDLLLLKQLIAYCNTAKDDQLPDHFMITFKLIRMADFLGYDTFLENTAKQLGTSVLKINSVKTVREYVRNAYRWASKSIEINQQQFCSVCRKSLAAQFPRLPLPWPLWFAANLKSIWLAFQTFQSVPAVANHTNFYPAVFAEEQSKLSPNYPTAKFG